MRNKYTDEMSAATAPSTRRALILAIALYLLWVLVTYLLEGRILTLQRPEATGARLVYALVANILIGIGGSVLVVRFLSDSGEISIRLPLACDHVSRLLGSSNLTSLGSKPSSSSSGRFKCEFQVIAALFDAPHNSVQAKLGDQLF